jgi:hypothetical protein
MTPSNVCFSGAKRTSPNDGVHLLMTDGVEKGLVIIDEP